MRIRFLTIGKEFTNAAGQVAHTCNLATRRQKSGRFLFEVSPAQANSSRTYLKKHITKKKRLVE
jgi:hypothetical protein